MFRLGLSTTPQTNGGDTKLIRPEISSNSSDWKSIYPEKTGMC